MRVARMCVVSLALALPSFLWAQAAVQHSAPESPKALTNADVVNMVKAGLSADTIVMAIRGSAASFDTTADGLIALKKTGSTGESNPGNAPSCRDVTGNGP